MFIHNAKQNSILPEICDNLCVEVASYKATLYERREVLDQCCLQGQLIHNKHHTMDQFNPIN